jgi:hypothetical protein
MVVFSDEKQAHRMASGEVLATCEYDLWQNDYLLTANELDKLAFYCTYTNVGDNFPENSDDKNSDPNAQRLDQIPKMKDYF